MTKAKARATDLDAYVGSRIRDKRRALGMSQEKLAEAEGITFQQIQKYENGANRVSASRLYSFSKILEEPVNYFFDGYESPKDKKKAR